MVAVGVVVGHNGLSLGANTNARSRGHDTTGLHDYSNGVTQAVGNPEWCSSAASNSADSRAKESTNR